MLSACREKVSLSLFSSNPGWGTVNESCYKAFVQETLWVSTLLFCQQQLSMRYMAVSRDFMSKWETAYLGGETYIWTCCVPHGSVCVLTFSKMRLAGPQVGLRKWLFLSSRGISPQHSKADSYPEVCYVCIVCGGFMSYTLTQVW